MRSNQFRRIETIPGLRSAEGTAGAAPAEAALLPRRQRETSEEAALRAMGGGRNLLRPPKRTLCPAAGPPPRDTVMEADIRLYLLQASPAAAVVVLAGGSNGCRLPPSPLPLSLYWIFAGFVERKAK